MLSALRHGALPHTVRTALGQIRVMQRAGIIDLRNPSQVARTATTMRAYGTIAGGIRTCARRTPDRIALIDGDRRMTYRQLDTRTDAIAARLHASGLDASDTIGVLCPDGLRLVETMSAAAKLGSRLVLLNTGFGAAQLRDVLVREQIRALVLDPSLSTLADGLPADITLLEADASRGGARLPAPAEQAGFVLLTGGTTGTPKGAPRRVESPLAAAQFVDRVPLRRGQTVLLCAPLFHGTALSQFIVSLNLGSTIVLHGRFDAARALGQIAEHNADMVVLIPTMLRRILDLSPEVLSANDTASLRIVFTAGAALPSSLGTRAIEVFGPVIYNFYGCTETGTATIATPQDWIAAPGTVGKPPVGITVALYDGDTLVTEPGAIGTVYVGNSIAIAGYSGGGSKQLRGGLMSTGDLGHFDTERRLFIDGRDDDMIVSGGENVFPGEIEDLLYQHPAITEAAVIGVLDEEFGQRLAAFIVPAAELDADTVRTYVKTHLARFKAPRDVLFVDELPRTPTGKIDRRGLAALR